MQMKHLVGDIIFLNPDAINPHLKKEYTEDFSIFRYMKSNLKALLKKALKDSNRVALKLPGNANLDEVALLFHSATEENGL